MDSQKNLLEEIEGLRNRIDHLRREIWERDKVNQTMFNMEYELENLLIEYLQHIREYEQIAC